MEDKLKLRIIDLLLKKSLSDEDEKHKAEILNEEEGRQLWSKYETTIKRIDLFYSRKLIVEVLKYQNFE
jgi:hypothetical protein